MDVIGQSDCLFLAAKPRQTAIWGTGFVATEHRRVQGILFGFQKGVQLRYRIRMVEIPQKGFDFFRAAAFLMQIQVPFQTQKILSILRLAQGDGMIYGIPGIGGFSKGVVDVSQRGIQKKSVLLSQKLCRQISIRGEGTIA
jgi:hypothetical protein